MLKSSIFAVMMLLFCPLYIFIWDEEDTALRIVRLWRTSVFTKNTTAFAVKFVLMSIDFAGGLGYNCYCDKNVKVYNVKE